MSNSAEETQQTSAYTPGGRRRHRRTRQGGSGVRRAVVLAITVPMASAALAGPSAFAASGNGATGTAAGATEGIDADDQ
jgi:D-alanyl-D-alanine carboxypeptidase/D-alanyl-D-alanine-endopeptidase (penicillin-binding protein 4)